MSSICLNMIVKNEEHIITQCFDSLYRANLFIKDGEDIKKTKQSKITNAVICDTGSDSDKCTNIIKEWFKNHNIPCYIYNHEWSDFGTNRSLALKECLGKSDYIFVIDADDLIEGTINIPKLDKDSYTVKFGKTLTYYRTQLFKNSKKLAWRYVGVLHECPESKLKNITKGTIDGDYYIDSRRLGARSQDPKKYLNDAKIFEKELLKDPNNARNVFYMAQSYFDYGDYNKAIEVYERRIMLGGWYEEIYYSMKRIGDAYTKLGYSNEKIETAYMRTYNSFKHRSEPLYCLARYYRLKGDFERAYKFGKLGITIPFPKDDLLFVDRYVYDYALKDELSISSYYVGNYLESSKLCSSILELSSIPQDVVQRTKQNLELANNKLKNLEKKTVIIYTGYSKVTTNIYNFIDRISNHYNVYIVGNVDYDNKNHNYTILDINSLSIFSIKEPIDVLIMYKSPELVLSNKDVISKAKRTILWQQSINIYYQFDDGLRLNCYSKELKKDLVGHVDLVLYDNIEDNEGTIFKKNNKYLNDKIYVLNKDKDNYSFLEGLSNELTTDNTKDIFDEQYIFEYPSYIIHEIKKDVVSDLFVLTLCNILKKVSAYIPGLPGCSESLYELSKIYMITKRFKLGIETMDKAILNIQNLPGEHKMIMDLIDIEYAKSEYMMGNYQQSFNRFTKVLRGSTIDDNTRLIVERERDRCINYIKQSTLNYPEKIINKIKNKVEEYNYNNNKHEIAVSITTCKRYDL